MGDVLPQGMNETTIASAAPHEGRLPFVFAKRYGVVLVNGAESPRALCRPDAPLQAIVEARRFAGHTLQVERVSAEEFDGWLRRTYEHSSNDAMQMMGDMEEDLDLAHIAQAMAEPEDLLESEDDAPIIRLINALLTEAVKEGASDIHIEPFENRLVVRFRVDGVLREVLQPQRALAPLLISRIKVMARLDIAEKRLPQDGRISLRVAGRPVDVRVSTLPSGHGERVVLRLLDKQAGRLDLEHLGMAPESRDELDRLIHHPHGIILVTGPTGSGKTTTLYAALTRLNDKSRNIMTVEDPIEYYLDGIGQTQVNTKVEMTFARGLRAILRQDPDVVMVGEIRDLETVQIAVQASLTGHLVLSTLHTNTAVGAVTRLRDMGLCPECKRPYQASVSEARLLGVAEDTTPTLYAAAGCSHCNHTGYRGRTGVYELFPVDDAAREMIHNGASETDLERHARERFPGIRQDSFRRVLNGDTTLEEVLRVTYEE
jgi:general secretion pathway protein E